ncbi:MAG: SRPBCC family protein [candidate division FCPU426 bacterium]
MPVLKLTQTINCPLDEAFAAVIDVENFPKWNPTTKSARKLSSGAIGEGSEFELEIKGFGKVRQTWREFEKNKRAFLVPTMKMMAGGHRFIFSEDGKGTRIDHELEMLPKGIFKLMTPMLGMIGKKNLADTAAALKIYLESGREA